MAGSRLDPAEGVDKAESDLPNYPDLVASLNDQLALLEDHRQKLQKLLAQASGS